MTNAKNFYSCLKRPLQRVARMYSTEQNRFILAVTLIANLIILIGLLVLVFQTQSAPMIAKVKSEVWVLDIQEGAPFPDYLSGLVRTPDLSTHCGADSEATNSVVDISFPRLSPVGMRITFVGIDSERISVTFEPKPNKSNSAPSTSGAHYAQYTCGGDAGLLVSSANFVYSLQSNSRRTFLARGIVTVGKIPQGAGLQGPRMLLSGEVIATAVSYPSSSGRVEVRNPLTMGDEVEFFASTFGSEQVQSAVIATYESDLRAFRLVVHSNAGRADVKQFGTNASYPIVNAPSPWARIQAQSEWTILLAFLAVLINCISAYRHYKIVESLSMTSVYQTKLGILDQTEKN